MRKFTPYLTSIAFSLCALSTSALAQDLSDKVQQGDITYVTGGIGERETDAIRDAKRDYKLRVVNAGPKGAFVGDAQTVIRDHKGNELLNVNSGPLFYANLPNGKYTMDVTAQGRTQSKSFTVASGKPTNLRFMWDAAKN